jgi:ATP/maltotriose-dependent transcriptional regulator MalT/DNA-binding SARP family transcriptional activator
MPAAMEDVLWSRLPPYHIRRPRLTERCLDERTVVVEAAGGYGKSVLAAELADAWGAVPVWVLLEEGGVSAQLLVARLRAALERAGFRDAAAAIAAAGDDPAGAVDALLRSLDGESCALLLDDVHHAARDAALLVDRIVEQLTPPLRLAVLARFLPPGLERLRRAGALHLDAADLALRPEETIELCRSGFGLDVSADDTRLLDAATGGWTAAAVLAASRAQRTAQPLGDLTRAGDSGSDAMDAILDEALATLGSERRLLAQIAPLPLLDADILAQVTGDERFFERALAAGLPLTRGEGSWWELPDPVRDRLGRLAAPDPAVLRAAAAHYERHGELGTALQMLLATGQAEEAARLLAEADLRATDSLDVLELLSVIDRIPSEVLDSLPRALLHGARVCAAAVLLQQRARLLARVDAVVSGRTAPELRRAIDAELLIDVLNSGNPIEAEAPARGILEATGAGEEFTRARALNVLGVSTYYRRDEDGSLPETVLREAADYLGQAAEIYRGLGHGLAVAGLAPHRAIWIELGLGRPLAALEILDEGVALASETPRARRLSRTLYYRALVLAELGRYDDMDADLDEVSRIAAETGDRMMAAYVHWQRMNAASCRGDAAAALAHAQQVEAERSDWWEVGGPHFLAEAADSLDRVGHTALAADYLARAQANPHDARRIIAMSECALLARHGDPELAEERLSGVHRQGIAPRELWRVALLRAYAASRRGDPGAAALAARAFEEAARLGQPQVPLLRERDVTEALLPLAVETGLPAALALESSSLPVGVSVLGRFEVTDGGRTVELGSGQGAQLLKLVAVSGGAVHAERAIETLWPEVDPTAGRNRLRTVLNRLREAAGDVVRREGELLALAPDVRLDLTQFHGEAREALALGRGAGAAAVAIARSAIARYRGDLLPHDLYEEWADEPRDAARRTMLDVLDLCAAAAADRGDLDETRRLVERSIELAPYDEERYLSVASILRDQGRRGAALSVLHRARSTLARIGIDPPRELVELEASVAAVTVRRSTPAL